MPQKSFPVQVNPAVLRWARESAGYSPAEVAQRLSTTPRAVEQWESGERPPGWRTLQRLARFLKRPVAALLLPDAPEESPLPSDFRKLPDSAKTLSPKTRLAIRLACWLADRANELEKDLGVERPPAHRRIKVTDDPEELGPQLRERLGVDLKEQAAFPDVYQAFQRWREALEQQGLFVFQFSMPLDEARGFSLFQNHTPVIVVNQSDACSARIFTLFHEYAHLLLSQPGICVPEESAVAGPRDAETFCNRFAAALLIPRDECERWKGQVPRDQVEGASKKLATRYRVSRYVALGRMRTLNLVTSKEYTRLTERWRAEPPPPRRGGGGRTTAERCVDQRGRALISLALTAEERGSITTSDAINYLGVKLTDLNRLKSEIG